MKYKNTSEWGKEKASKYADGGSVPLHEKVSRYLNGGRDLGQRAFYNATRVGLWNSESAPENGTTYGGLGSGLDTRRKLQGYDARDISDAVPRRKSDKED